ncbi:MAG: PEGA domain-containing protein, partial [Kofleriaceae bacterium]
VIDFGIAKATSRNSRTMAGVLKGKFGYMSPEQVRGLPLDRRSDIFALGTMLYECLTSERLFQGETDFSTLEKVRNVDIRQPRELNPAIPEAVERVILKALAKDVDDRYQWCSEMHADLQQFLMSQDVVFTAKTLSSWLKEVFQGEIDKERALLEQYKRVGRDGLIQGLPSAEAKLDVIEHLGAAPAIEETDATQLGGPSFDDIEQAVAASAAPEVGPAPGSPAARGAGPPPKQRAASRSDGDDDGDNDFGEEAPTEIFGEIDHGANPAPVAAPPRAATASQPAARPRPPAAPAGTGARPSNGNGNGNGRMPTSAPAAAAASGEATMNISEVDIVPPTPAQAPYPSYPQAYQQPVSQPYPQQYAGYPNGTPQQMPQMPPPMAVNALHDGLAGQTLMGAAAPPSLQNYGSYPPYAPHPSPPQQGYDYSQQPPMYPSHEMHAQHPSQPQQLHPSQPHQQQQHPSQPQQQHPSQPQQQYPSAQGYLNQGYGQAPYPSAAAAVDVQTPATRKKSSIGRDVAIGVLIAAVVLGGFLLVKFFILDADDDATSTTAAATGSSSAPATLKIEMPANLSADLFLDDGKEKLATVKNADEIPVPAGSRKIRIQDPSGQKCEKELKLVSGKTTTVVCDMPAKVAETKPADPPPATTTKPEIKTDPKQDPKTEPAKTDPTKPPPKTEPAKPETAAKPDATKLDPKTTKVEPAKTEPFKTDAKTVKPETTKLDPTKLDPKAVDPKLKPKDKLPPEDNPADKAAAMSTKGILAISSTPSAKVAIDGVDTGQSTPMKLPVTPGKHKVTYTLGGDKFTFTVTVKVGETTALSKELQ